MHTIICRVKLIIWHFFLSSTLNWWTRDDERRIELSGIGSRKLSLMKRKLELAQALKSLHTLIVLSKQKTEIEKHGFKDQKHEQDWREEDQGWKEKDQGWRRDDQERETGERNEEFLESFAPGTTVVPWWARTNSHGRRRRRRKAPGYSVNSFFN